MKGLLIGAGVLAGLAVAARRLIKVERMPDPDNHLGYVYRVQVAGKRPWYMPF